MLSRTPSLNTSRLFLLLLALVACLSDLRAQTTTPQDRGFQPGGSYAVGDIETINLSGGNLMINLPLAGLPAGRGGAGSKLSLTYNSKIWNELVNNPQNHQCPSGAVCAPPPAATNTLVESPEGGWNYAFRYELQLDTRDYPLPTSYNASQYNPCNDNNAVYYYRLMVRFPDGGQHEFKLQGQQDSNGYYKYKPDGSASSWCSSTQPLTGTLNYYTTDGTYMRLEVEHDSDTNWSNNPWTLYLPDGGRVTGGNAAQRIYDRNDNYVEVQSLSADPAYNNHVTVKLVDQVGRKVVLEYGSAAGQDSIHSWGVNNVEMVTTIKWKDMYVYKSYRPGAVSYFKPTGLSPMRVVDYITLPAQSGGLQYTFGYNPGASNPSYGWGELNSVTLPTGATTAYQYSLDGQDQLYTSNVINGRPTRKDLTYQQEYDGVTTPVTETWLYTANTVTAPDGGVTTETFSGERSKKTESPDGTVVERDWQRNSPFGAAYYQFAPGPMKDNYYVKSEYSSIRNAGGTLVKTAIKDYTYDKNGNVTSVKEYDWVDWSSVHDGSGNPVWNATRPAAVKETYTGYYNDTPDASDTSTDDPDVYHKSTSPRKHNSVAWSEVRDPAVTSVPAVARTEFTYDNPATRGNLTVRKSWDSTKGVYSNPLTASNSVSVTTQYDGYGNPTLITDPNQYQTKLTYGAVGGFTDLYPTKSEAAYGTTVKRTTTTQYDFSTGLATTSTDSDNNVSSSTAYDVFGRPTLVKAAVGTADESRVQTVYDDAARRVVVRSDLNAVGDGGIVSVQHYDQLGRVRLSRILESPSSAGETDETAGIKVQTRYRYNGSNSYVVISNTYRSATSAAATGENTMGWTVRTSDRGDRAVRSETFGGAGLPAPWGTNSNSTGVIVTSYNAESITVTEPTTSAEPTLRERRSVTDALGRLTKIYEDPTDPNDVTTYTYDAFGNLTGTSQGIQTRAFKYSSLSLLTSSTNPEACQQGQSQCVPVPVTYEYDANSNLKKKTDARGVTTTYTYDELNRVKTKVYGNEAGTYTPNVTYSYDSPAGANSKGRLWKVETAGVSANVFDAYDSLGRAKQYHHSFWAGGAYGPDFGVQYSYNKAGAVISQTYPSNHSVTYSYDSVSRLADSGAQPAFSGNLGDGVQRTYASQMLYAPSGGMTQERFGTDTPVYNKRLFNNRAQLAEIRVSTSPITAAGQLATDWNRGAIINHFSNSTGAWGATGGGPDNNGNLRKQDIYIPNTDNVNDGFAQSTQFYSYDSLNRLYQARESYGGSNIWVQYFKYDRWGNRTIDAANTTGSAPEPQFSVDASTNRLGVPVNQSGVISYDSAGNLTNDTYQGGGTRTYDAENRMTSAQFVSGQTQTALYTYDGDGRRVKRKAGAGDEVWQVYGMGGELLAEYAANASPNSPQKEYGYRSGELLVTAEPGQGSAVTYRASTDFSNVQGQRGWYYLDSAGAQMTYDSANNWWRGSETYNVIWAGGEHPGAAADAVRQWRSPGAGFIRITGSVSDKDTVCGDGVVVTISKGTQVLWQQTVNNGDATGLTYDLTTSVATGDQINFTVNRRTEYSCDGTNFDPTVAYTPAQTTYRASTDFSNVQGQRGWYYLDSTGAQMTYDSANNWWRGSETYNVIWAGGGHPGAAADAVRRWVALVGGTVRITGSVSDKDTVCGDGVVVTISKGTQVLWQQTVNNGDTTGLTYDLTTSVAAGDQINFTVNKRTEYSCDGTNFDPTITYAGASATSLQWLVADQLGTPRMIVDKTGSLSGVKRHDYFPFGEEIPGDVAWRTDIRGYKGYTGRQQFTSKERDGETGLDYSINRYYASTQGRFTSPDPTLLSLDGANPQTLNRYSYVQNNPLRFIDPLGLWSLEYAPVLENERTGKVKAVKIFFHKTKDSDTAEGLLKQLGFKPTDKGYDAMKAQIDSAMKAGGGIGVQDLGIEAASLKGKVAGIDIGAVFNTIGNLIGEQANHQLKGLAKANKNPGPENLLYNDCTMTTARLSFGVDSRVSLSNLGTQKGPSGMDEQFLRTAGQASYGDLRLLDAVRYDGDGDVKLRHYATVVFTDDDGKTEAFSRSGVNGRFHIVPVNEIKGYGKIGGTGNNKTGFYRP